ncbi:hypothetical protein BU17DRAFT_81527 [Hysterangium stoloniferum]|nr:hypothetical protein BU17DRAFT_81527 [Hysterangium stoloniferum]
MTCCHNTRDQNTPAQPAQPAHRATPLTSAPVPSPVILSLLAALPQHSQRNIDLDFLLPPLPIPLSSSSSSSTAIPTADPAHSSTRRRRGGASKGSMTYPIPPKLSQSSDGHWYPVTEWTLHGRHHQMPSSVQDISLPAATKSPSPSGDLTRPATDDVAPNNVNFGSSDTIISEYNDIITSLPTGWEPRPDRTKFYDVPVIVVISLILAIVVTLVITGCVLGHKAGTNTKRSKSRTHGISEEEKDLESDGESRVRVKKTKRKTKMWEMWRRQGAKIGLRRRGRKAATAASTRDIRVDDDEQTPRPSFVSVRTAVSNASLRAATSRQVEPSSTPEGSIAPAPLTPPATTEIPPIPPTLPAPSIPALTSSSLVASTSSNIAPIPSAPPPPPTTSSLPPAYRRLRPKHKSTSTKAPHISIHIPPSPSDVSISTEMPSPEHHESGDGDNEDDHDAPPLRAHIATDDKATLERMRMATSAPSLHASLHDQDADIPGTAALDIGVNAVVPEWIDERVEDFGGISSPVSPPPSHMQPRPHSPSLSQSRQCDPGPSTPRVQQNSLALLPPPPHGIHLYRHLDVGTIDELEGDGALPYYVPRFLGEVLSMGGSISTTEETRFGGSECAKSGGSGVPSSPSAPSEPSLDLDLRPSAPPAELEDVDMRMRMDDMDARPSAPPMPMEDDEDD